ncbi:TOG array regulator of axonemal microtubules protein 2 isoform X2 [Oxyura jamaicensis]|uniref:TOG array regulator of axonemal microtubules protein 2 isoform X2 n=1 Tax=Oxyura jamaicensis TaxID=8884 RepID=UPI0015A666B0|nr:TOG array regulator of axonemal microtubules protein 2 isoform X2 [Oxyura jamaicensis]
MATEDNFAAAKYHAPVAVYCGSITKDKPRCRAVRGGSIDSNLQLCGSRWTTEEEASLQSMLTTQMKKQQPCLGNGDGEPPQPRAISSMEDRDSKVTVYDPSAGAGGFLSHFPRPALMQDPQEREVSSAALETTQIKDKLKKRRMSEGLLAPQRGLTDSSDSKGITLKPAVSRSASQRLLATSRPVPPIQNRLPSPEPSWTSNREQEHEENGTGCGGCEGNHKELMSEASLQPLYCSDEDGKKSLGVALIPPIPRSARPSDGDPGSAAVPLPSSQELVSQESLEMRPRSGSKTEEKTLKSLELRTLEPILPIPQHHVACNVKSAGHLYEPVPTLTGLPLSQAKEMDHLTSPHLLRDDDWKDSNGRIHVTISKSAQEKMRQKRMREMELLRREREKEREKLQLSTCRSDPGITDEEGFGLQHINGTVPISSRTSNACRSSIGTTLRKRVNRPSLPSIPVISQDSGFLRHSSANSLPAIALGSLEWGEEPECGDAWEARPFSHPEQGLLDALTWLSSNDWQLKGKGLFSIRRLAICHSEILLGRLHDVTLAVTKEVNNLRSKVSRFAISTLGELFRIMKKHMDQEVEEVARALLQKTGDSSEFIQKAADRSLGIMVGSVTPARAMAALLASGVNHRNVLVRKYAAEHLLTVMEQIGAEKLLSGTRDSTELLVHTLVKLAQDCNQDTRFYGRKMLNILMSHPKFDGYLKQFIPSRDLRDVMATIKQKGIEDRISELPSAKGRRESRSSGVTVSQENLPSDEGSRSVSDVLILPRQTVRHTSLRTVEEIEQLKELNKLLTAKEFQTRMEGVVLLVDHCKNNPQLISANIVQIFDAFVPRLQDSNKKVNQQALEALASITPILRDSLHPVLISLVAAVTDNLNSKHTGIYTAAVKVLEASIAHLDNTLLLQVLAHRVRFLSGRAMQDVTEHLSVLVASVYPRKAPVVERYALPVLWYFLSNMIGNGVLPGRSSNVRAAVTKLAKSLYQEMGSSLKEHAAGQPQHVAKNLWHVLDLDVR